MAYHCIIVPFDGSDHAQSALNAACGIAKGHDTQVHVSERGAHQHLP